MRPKEPVKIMMLIKNTLCGMFVNNSHNIYPKPKKLSVCLEECFRANGFIPATFVVILSRRNQNILCYIVLNLIRFGKHYGIN